mmetsp:Transcript_131629/g.196146  ORF Transcript_131629/g.196146 Transcript_131629/m.196146 type:complete len:379 (+) Transcript_131629:7-1143(+)
MSNETPTLPPLQCQISGSVPRVQSASDPIFKECLKNERPCVIENSTFSKSLMCLSTDFLSEHLHDIPMTTFGSLHNRFMYSNEEKNEGKYYFRNPVYTFDMPFKEYAKCARKCDNKNQQDGYPTDLLLSRKVYNNDIDTDNKEEGMQNSKFFYCQTVLPVGVGKPVQEALSDIEWLFLKDCKVDNAWGKMKSTVLWASQRGCVTQCHYDECHNIMAHIQGEKRFILFHPHNFDSMYPFPKHHAADRQSQVNFYAPQTDLYPKHGEAVAVEALLNPGDVLYLPPYWWHHVETLTESVGMNFWFEIAPFNMATLKFPLTDEQVIGVRRNLEKFLANVVPPREIGKFLRTITLNRWETVEAETEEYEANKKDEQHKPQPPQ